MILSLQLRVSAVGGANRYQLVRLIKAGGVTFAKINLPSVHTHHNPASHSTAAGLNQTQMWHLSAAAADVRDDVVPVACSASRPQTHAASHRNWRDSDVIKHTADEVGFLDPPSREPVSLSVYSVSSLVGSSCGHVCLLYLFENLLHIRFFRKKF